MSPIAEKILGFLIAAGIVVIVLIIYLLVTKRRSRNTDRKIDIARESGFHEPVSLHPVIDINTCIGSGACYEACPERDILGWAHGRAKVINASRCVGHGACFHACPVEAISLYIGTEKRGVELPHVSQEFETNIPMLFIAGELGGMGLIKNAVEQGRQAVEFITKKLVCSRETDYDLIVVGAGPAGISASLAAKKNNLRCLTLEQDTLGGTVYNFPRKKIIMTAPMELPLYGKVNKRETSKAELISLWEDVLSRNDITINQQEKVLSIEKKGDHFELKTTRSEYSALSVILAIGRRGSPRKLGVPGEEKEKVYYRLLEPELIHNENILVVGGGDSAVESAMLLADEGNNVTLSYRSEKFVRLKPRNLERITEYAQSDKINLLLNSTVKEIKDELVILNTGNDNDFLEIANDTVYVFAGGEMPNEFLQNIGIKITKKFGEAVLTHQKN